MPASVSTARTALSRFEDRTVVRTRYALLEELEDAVAGDEAGPAGDEYPLLGHGGCVPFDVAVGDIAVFDDAPPA